jgi:transcriptional regulator with XRE-family HTH domain
MSSSPNPFSIRNFVDSFEKGWYLGMDLSQRKKVIADRLRFIRIQAGLKQKDIAEKIKLNPTTYSGYENEVTVPPIEALIRIADLYQISLDYLTGRTDNLYGIQATYGGQGEIQAPSNNELVKRIEKLEEIINSKNSVNK